MMNLFYLNDGDEPVTSQQHVPYFTYAVFAAIITCFPRLWGEAVIPRLYHHIDRDTYVKARKPKISQPLFRIFKHLMPTKKASTMRQIIHQVSSQGGVNTLSYWLSWFFVSQYSTKTTLYYPDIKKSQVLLEDESILTSCENFAHQFLKPKFENECGKKLELTSSDFRVMAMRYEGGGSSFRSHLDNEPFDYYRSLTLIHKRGIPPLFFYVDPISGKKCEVDLDIGDTIFFQGSLLEHGVTASLDETAERYMIGFQWKHFQQGTEIEPDSLCNKFRHTSLSSILLECATPWFTTCATFVACNWLLEDVEYTLRHWNMNWILCCLLAIAYLACIGCLTFSGASAVSFCMIMLSVSFPIVLDDPVMPKIATLFITIWVAVATETILRRPPNFVRSKKY